MLIQCCTIEFKVVPFKVCSFVFADNIDYAVYGSVYILESKDVCECKVIERFPFEIGIDVMWKDVSLFIAYWRDVAQYLW